MASVPDATIEYVRDAPASASVAVYVSTVVVPSLTVTASVSPSEKTGELSLVS